MTSSQEQYFLDFYTEGNDGETSSHGRIREDGSVTPLENLISVHRHFDDPNRPGRSGSGVPPTTIGFGDPAGEGPSPDPISKPTGGAWKNALEAFSIRTRYQSSMLESILCTTPKIPKMKRLLKCRLHSRAMATR